LPGVKKTDILLYVMNKDLQPKIYKNCVVTCACGNTFVTFSTKPKITADICSNCHPYYTGKQRFVDTEGRLEKFEKKVKFAEAKKASLEAKKNKNTAQTAKGPKTKKTLKEMLEEAQK